MASPRYKVADFCVLWFKLIMLNFSKMNVIGLIIAVSLAMSFCVQDTQAGDVSSHGSQPLSISELKKHITAPRIYSVEAYVIHKDDECPPCPPNAVCETCVLGIYVADDNRPRKPGVVMNDGIYLQTNKARRFQVGIKYQFRIRYRLEMNAAGAWLQTGPELIDFTHIGPENKHE